MTTARLEAFSDGVMAVAITLLVLDIRVPPISSAHPLAHALLAQWPSYVAYAISFLTIGIIWINHHAQISRLRNADHTLLILNLLLLMSVSLIPFGTSLMADYLKSGNGQRLAAGIYGGTLLAMSLTFTAVNRYILIGHPELLNEELEDGARRLIFRRAVTGLIPYVIATALAAVSPYLTLGISGALAIFYAMPVASGRDVEAG